MQICKHKSASAFLARAESWLLRAEAENNVAIGVARLCRTEAPDGPSDAYWFTAERDGNVVGCAFRTPPHRVRVTRIPFDAIPALVEDVHAASSRVPGVGGPVAEAERFAAAWARRFDVEWRVRTRLRLHVLTRVALPARPPPGRLCPAKASELELVREWSTRFVRELDIIEDAEKLARRLLASGRLYFWHDEHPRCMVAAARETPKGVCVNAVFTPSQDRGRGYATAAVASLSQLLLADGYRFCCLYTDIDDPTPNAIYRRVGFEPVQDEVDIDFRDICA